jgi:CheY-like chemotaxis protein
LTALLTGLGHQVEAVEDGRRLVEKCRAWPPDLVLTDIEMPGLDGPPSSPCGLVSTLL